MIVETKEKTIYGSAGIIIDRVDKAFIKFVYTNPKLFRVLVQDIPEHIEIILEKNKHKSEDLYN